MRPLAIVAGALIFAALQAGVLVVADRVVGRVVAPEFVPLAGAPGTRTTLARSEFRVRVRTNAAGFRGGPLPAGRAPDGTVRIVVVGDSFTWGYGVRERQAYPARLARLLQARTGRRVEVVNLGLPGAGPLDYLHDLDSTGLPLAPDVVLVGLFANDVNDLYQVRRHGLRGPLYALAELRADHGERAWWKAAASAALPNLYVLTARAVGRLHPGPGEAQAAPARNPTPADPERVIAALGARYGRRDEFLARYRAFTAEQRAALATLVRGESPGNDMRPLLLLGALVDPDAEADAVLLRSPGRRAAADETARVLAGAITRSRGRGARPVLALFPASEQVNEARWPALEAAGYRLDPAMLVDTRLEDTVAAVAAHEQVPFVDLVAAFRRHRGADLYYHVDEHWNARGQAFAAARLADALAPLVASIGVR